MNLPTPPAPTSCRALRKGSRLRHFLRRLRNLRRPDLWMARRIGLMARPAKAPSKISPLEKMQPVSVIASSSR